MVFKRTLLPPTDQIHCYSRQSSKNHEFYPTVAIHKFLVKHEGLWPDYAHFFLRASQSQFNDYYRAILENLLCNLYGIILTLMQPAWNTCHIFQVNLFVKWSFIRPAHQHQVQHKMILIKLITL